MEYGFGCTNTTCRDILNPQFSIKTVTRYNELLIEFSETIVLEKSTTISEENLDIKISGPTPPYNFGFNFTQEYKAGDELKNFIIALVNITTSLNGLGKEQVYLNFINPESINDLSGNPLLPVTLEANLTYYIYVPEAEMNSVENVGQSTKFAAIMLLLLNLALKILLKSAMSFLWDLVHILQVFRYEILLNI